jgi:NTP pyrophosphatase (non-canonical NTP hydrolase)
LKELTYLYENSLRACEIAGQDKEFSYQFRKQQLSYIQSEVQELADALEELDLVEELDACQDILVTVFGYLQKLEALGARVDKAMVKTADNNLSKFPTTLEEVQQTQEFYKTVKNKETVFGYNSEYKRYVVRDMNGKYLKCKSFVENDLSDCFDKGE